MNPDDDNEDYDPPKRWLDWTELQDSVFGILQPCIRCYRSFRTLKPGLCRRCRAAAVGPQGPPPAHAEEEDEEDERGRDRAARLPVFHDPNVPKKVRRCLKCDREFLSTSRSNRLCRNCRNENLWGGSDPLERAAVVHSRRLSVAVPFTPTSEIVPPWTTRT